RQLEIDVEIDDAAGLAVRRLDVLLGTAAIKRFERQRVGRQRLGQTRFDVALQHVDVRSAAAGRQHTEQEKEQESAHVQPPMNPSERNTVSTAAFSRSTKNAPASGTIRKDLGAGPYLPVMACMLAMAVAVEPRLKPMKPAVVVTAS